MSASRKYPASCSNRAGTPLFTGPQLFGPCRVLLLCLAVLVPVAETTAQASLSLEHALALAEARSLALPAQDDAIHGALELSMAARELPDPVMTFSANNVPVNGSMRYSLTEDFMTMRSIEVMQTFTRHDKRMARSARYAREADYERAMGLVELTKLRTQTAQAWFNLYFAQRALDLLDQQHATTRRLQAAAESAFGAATGSQGDVFAARGEVALVDDRLQEANATIDNTRTALERWIGSYADASLAAPPDLHTMRDFHDLDHHVFSRHAEINLLEAQANIARAEAEIAKSEKHVDPTWSLMYSDRGGQFSDMVSIGVSVPLQWRRGQRQQRVVASELDRARQLSLMRQEREREHGAMIHQWITSWQTNQRRLVAWESSLLPLAIQQRDATASDWQSGRGTLAEVFKTRRQYLDLCLERLRIEQENASIWADLAYLMPADVTDTPAITATNEGMQP